MSKELGELIEKMTDVLGKKLLLDIVHRFPMLIRTQDDFDDLKQAIKGEK